MVEAEVRRTLEEILVELDRELAVLTRRPEPGAGIGFGKRVGDSTSLAVERITDVAKQEQLLTKREQTERALAKVADGSYGRCDVCAEPIGAERLEFRPYATRCMRHAD